MKVGLCPSGHSDDYAMILAFKSEEEALRKKGELKRCLHDLGKFCNGSLIVPYRLQHAFFVDYELNQDVKSRRANSEFQAKLKRAGARITKVYSPRKDAERQVWLSFTLPRSEDLLIMTPEQLVLLQNVTAQARRPKQPTLPGSATRIHCTLPDGKKSPNLYIGWEGVPIKLLKSTLKNLKLVTPAGVFPLV